MQTYMSQTEISRLSTSALHTLIRDLENEIACERSPSLRARLEEAKRFARTELARRQMQFAPKPPGF